MKQNLVIIISFLFFGCARTTEPDKTSITKESAKDSVLTGSNIVIISEKGKERIKSEDEVEPEEEGCVFDTSTYKFTTGAIRKYNNQIAFSWDKKSSNALVKLNDNDSLILHIGGCNHFSYQATFITSAEKFVDREYLIRKTKWLAKTFFSNGFDEKYIYYIENKLYKLENPERRDYLYYTIIDPDTSMTDHIYEGWSFEKVGGKTRINLVGYQN